jgi:hypothetical protein
VPAAAAGREGTCLGRWRVAVGAPATAPGRLAWPQAAHTGCLAWPRSRTGAPGSGWRQGLRLGFRSVGKSTRASSSIRSIRFQGLRNKRDRHVNR